MTTTANVLATLTTQPTVTAASGTLVAGGPNPVDATAGNATWTLPAPTAVGQLVGVEKIDSTAHTVTVQGTIDGVSGTVVLVGQHEAVTFTSESMSSWRPISDRKPLAFLDGRYPQAGAYVPTIGVVKADALTCWGHSIPFGIGASDRSKRASAILAAKYGLREDMDAIPGSVFTSVNAGSSWVKFLQNVVRTGTGAVNGSVTAASGDHGFALPGGFHYIHTGIDDLEDLGNTLADLAGFQAALTTAISRLRAGAVFEAETDATFAFTGFGTTSDTTQNSGTGYRYATANASYTITTPADFPGGTIAIGITARQDGGVGTGATHTATYNGQTYQLVATNPYSTGGLAFPYVLRIPNVAAGTQTISVTVTAVNTITVVDYWQWEAAGQGSPLVVLIKQPYPTSYADYANTPPGPPTNAGVDALNSVIGTVAALFDSMVVTVDTSSMNEVASYLASDGLHFNDAGNAKVASLVEAAISTAQFVPLDATPAGPRIKYGNALPDDTRTFSEPGDIVWNSAPGPGLPVGWVCTAEGNPGTWLAFGPSQVFDTSWQAPTFANGWVNLAGASGDDVAAYRRDSNGFVHLKGTIASGTLAAPAFTLPAGYRPALSANFPTISNGGLGLLIINNAGVVQPQTGSNVSFGLDGVSFHAEQ